MKPVAKWACIGAALAFVQYFIFNGAHQHDWINRVAMGLLGIVVWSIVGAIVGMAISIFRRKE